MNIVIRTDASLQIGTGHVMRCLTLANALRESGADCRFVCREHPGNLIELIRENGFEVSALSLQNYDAKSDMPGKRPQPAHAAWVGDDWKNDAEATVTALDGDIPDWLIVDHYGLDARWESALGLHCDKLMVIDDLADRQHDCDLLLDQNLVANWAHRYDDKLPKHCGKMLGPDYALLQQQYAHLHTRTPPREGPLKRILVYFGGADTANLTGLVIAAFLSLDRTDIALDVVVSSDSPHNNALQKQVSAHQQITVHSGLPSLAPLMVKADLAIGGAGTTSWERCCLGLPAFVITLAENQRPIATELDRRGLIRLLGHYDEVSEDGLAQALREVLDTDLKPSWSESCQEVVDGIGVTRVRGLLLFSAKTQLTARLARLEDEKLFLELATDPMARANDLLQSTFEPETHRDWYRRRLRDHEHYRLYVVETDEGLPIGQVQFSCSGDAWEIDYRLDARVDCVGLPSRVMITAMLALRSDTNKLLLFSHRNAGHQTLSAELAPANGASPSLVIAVCSDAASWINNSIPKLILRWLADGHTLAWVHSASDLPQADLCFYLSYGEIVDSETLSRFRHNLVVHASDLPKGRGWSPASWLILENSDRIPVTLIEAVEAVDAGPIYRQYWLELDGTELIDDWRALIAEATVSLSQAFVSDFSKNIYTARDQAGEPTFYSRRRANDSRLDENKTLSAQFNQLRIADNDQYPAFFSYKGKEFVLKIFSR